jgi:4'-phosphopantetheinyl transferase
MDAYWLEQTDTDLPSEHDWLSEEERIRLSGLRFLKRRSEWRLGRWTAKRAVAAYLHLPHHLDALAQIEILAAASGAPEVRLLNAPATVAISLSHRAGTALCAVAPSEASLGCDVETVEQRSDVFVEDYFTASEQALVENAPEAQRPLLVTLIWSAKESALKALREGLRLDTRTLDVSPIGFNDDRDDPDSVPRPADGLDGWRPLLVRYSGSTDFCGWWRHGDGLVRTVVSALPLPSPLPLRARNMSFEEPFPIGRAS